MRPSRSLPLLAAVASAALLAGCSATPAADPANPGTDEAGSFTLYSGRDEELVQPLIDLFEEQTGITVDVRYGNTAELGALLLEEGEATPAQVFLSQDAGALGALSQAGLFATLPDDIAGAVPAGFTSTDDSWVGITGRARVVVYDSEQFTADELPDTVAEYVEPEWAGRWVCPRATRASNPS